VIGLNGVNDPLPQQATAVTCTLNNGIHFAATPECQFDRDSRIDQEFELSDASFSLSLWVDFKLTTPIPLSKDRT
jgi:hypothetical protein